MAEVKRFYYEEGSLAREIADPLPSREEREREREEEERRIHRAKERRKKAAMRQNRFYTVCLCTGLIISGIFFFAYIHLQAESQSSMRRVAALQGEIQTLKAENSARSNRIHAKANLSVVKDTALNKLGMVYAGSDKIVYYDVDAGDYMSQFEDIP